MKLQILWLQRRHLKKEIESLLMVEKKNEIIKSKMDTTEKNNQCKECRVNQMQKFSSEGEHKIDMTVLEI